MWIQAPENYRSIAPVHEDSPGDFDEPVKFNDNGSANVSESIGTHLVEKYDIINEYETENKEDN